jgi:HTH-type transcriptional regulator/antitoxin HigA
MAEIKNEIQYKKLLERMEELLQVVGNDTPPTNKDFVELDLLSDLIVEYEEKYYPISFPGK